MHSARSRNRVLESLKPGSLVLGSLANIRRVPFAWLTIAWLACAVTSLAANETGAETKAGKEEQVSYQRQILPVLQANCLGCHQPAKASGGYVMTAFDALLAGGDSDTPAIVPGKPDESYLLELITPTDGSAEMPQDGKPLAESQIGLFRRWIEQGANNDATAKRGPVYSADNPPRYFAPPVIPSIDFSPDGKLLAVAGFHEVLLHHADGSGLVARLVGMSERIESVRFSPDGTRLAVAGGQPARMGEVQIWDVAKRALTLSLPIGYDTVYGANWSPNGKLVSFGCPDNTLRVIEADGGKQVLFQGSHSDWVFDTVFSLQGDHLISVGRDRTVKLTELATQRFVDNITTITPGISKGGVGSVDRHPTSDAVVVGGADGVPKIYRVFRQSKRVIGDDANLIKKLPNLGGPVFGVAFSPDGTRVAAGGSSAGRGRLAIFAVDFEVQLPAALKKIVEKVITSRSAKEIGQLAQARTEGVRQIADINISAGGVYAVSFSPDGKTLAAAGADGTVRLYDAATGASRKSFLPVTLSKPEPAPRVAKQVEASSVAEKSSQPAADAAVDPLPDDASVLGIDVQPAALKLDHRYDTVQLIVTARLNTGATVDVTRSARRELSADVVSVSPTGLVRTRLNGQARLRFTMGSHSAMVPVDISGVRSDAPVRFTRDVAPVIAKLGCNAGTCHGSKKGKNGFKLSLRGYDPQFDVRALTEDLASRRINVASPADSLALLKATAAVPHVGGQVTRPGEPYYRILRRWITAGAKLDADPATVSSIAIWPENPLVQHIGDKQQVRVVATYADGSQRDVSGETHFDSSNTDIVKTDSSGLVTTLRRGEAAILARYQGAYAATTVTVMGDRSGFVWQEQAANNPIDTLVARKWKRLKISPSPLCSEAEFMRRVYLDVTGLPPGPREVEAFLKDSRPSRIKRDALIDRLVGSEEYVEHWTNKWADLLQVNRKFLAVEGAKSFRAWIRRQVAADTPYDRFVYTLLTATGSNRKNPAASYFKILRTPEQTLENTTQLFMAVRFSCNKCHDHPFERWTQDQYYQTAAFFARVGLKKDPESKDRRIQGTAVEGAKPLYEIVYDREQGEEKNLRTGQVAAPQFPFLASHTAPEDATRRQRLARWITSADNQYFASSYVNRIWGYLLGKGLIDPLDDIRAGNPPSNPELLRWLTRHFVESHFSVQDLIRTICKSRTYQLSIKTNRWDEDDQLNYSHAYARRLPAEVLYDAIHKVAGSVSKIPGVPPGTRAAALPDAGVKIESGFLQSFGRPARESACECERSEGMQLGPVMALVSGPTLNDVISDPDNALARLAQSDSSDPELVGEIFLRILNRPATPDELAETIGLLQSIPVRHKALLATLAQYRETLGPVTAKKELARQQAIAQAKRDLEAYQQQLAPRLAELEKNKKEHRRQLEKELAAYEKTLPAQLVQWEQEKVAGQTVWVPLDPYELTSSFGAKLTREADSSVFASAAKGTGTYSVTARTNLIGITALRLEVLADPRLPGRGPGRFTDGNFVLTELKVSSTPATAPDSPAPVVLQNGKADFDQSGYDVNEAINGKLADQGDGWGIAPENGVDHVATFELKEPVGDRQGTILTFQLHQLFNSKTHTIGRFRLSVTTSPRPVGLQGIPANVANLLNLAADQRNEKQKQNLLSFYRTIDAGLRSRNTAIEESKKPLPIDPRLQALQDNLEYVSRSLPKDGKLARLERAVEISTKQVKHWRLTGLQDIAWALINSPAFLFNR